MRVPAWPRSSTFESVYDDWNDVRPVRLRRTFRMRRVVPDFVAVELVEHRGKVGIEPIQRAVEQVAGHTVEVGPDDPVPGARAVVGDAADQPQRELPLGAERVDERVPGIDVAVDAAGAQTRPLQPAGRRQLAVDGSVGSV